MKVGDRGFYESGQAGTSDQPYVESEEETIQGSCENKGNIKTVLDPKANAVMGMQGTLTPA